MRLYSSEWSYSLQQAYDEKINPRWIHQANLTDSYHACWFIKSGYVDVFYQSHKLRAKSGQWLFNEPFQKRSHRFAQNTELVSIRFRANNLAHHLQKTIQTSLRIKHEDCPNLLEAGQKLASFEKESTTPLSPSQSCKRNSLFYEWLSYWHMIRSENTPPEISAYDPRILLALKFLSREKPAGPVKYNSLSQETQLSRAQIDRLFKKNLGATPREWKEHHCLIQATRHLSEDGNSVKWIAYELGFVDSAHFCKWFKSKTSSSPSEFRNSEMI